MLTVVLAAVALPAAAWAGPIAASGAATLTTLVRAAPSCVSPLGTYGGTLSFQVSGVDPTVVTADGATTLTVTGSYTNTGQDEITSLGYKFQRGDPLTSTDEIRTRVDHPCQPIAVIDSGFRDLPGTLKAGASADFAATVPITGKKKSSLAISKPGVYPVMININATLHLKQGPTRARVGELHLLVTVLSVPGGGGSTIPGESTPAPGIALNMLWPLVDERHLGVDGVFLNDDLAHEVAPGGRLRILLDTLTSSGVSPDAVTLVVDPMLLDELDRMSHGYWVQASGTAQAPLTPTLNGTSTGTAKSTATATKNAATTSTETTQTTQATQTTPTTQTTQTTPTTPTTQATQTHASGSTTTSSAPSKVSTGSTAASSPDARSQGATASTAPSTGLAGNLTATARTTTPGHRSGSTSAPSTPAAPPTTTTSGPGPRPKNTVAGTGRADATAFLDQLRTLARSYHVLVLPYGDPDEVALVRADMADDLATAVYRGRAVAQRVLRQPAGSRSPSLLVTSVALPPDGLLDTATMQVLLSLGYTSAILDRSGRTDSASPPLGVVPGALSRRTVPAILPDAPLAEDFDTVMSSGVPGDWPERLNTLAALLAQEHTDGPRTPIVLSPDRDWSPDRAGFSAITSLLSVLSDQGVVTGTPLADIAATAAHQPAQATLNYPTSAEDDELSADYLDRIQDIEQSITALGESLTADPGPEGADPADILGPLQDALLGSASVSLRGSADPDPQVLDTVTATLDSLYHGVSVRRTAGSYTLASSSAPLLLTVQNTLPYQVTVDISILGGGPAGLVTHDPGPITIAAGPRTKPVKIQSQVSRSGTFTVYAQLRGPDGADWGPRVPVTITSHAYGALTLVLMLVAGGVLVLMVAFRIHQRWRARQRRLAGEADAGAGAGAAAPGATASGVSAGGVTVAERKTGDDVGGAS